MERNSLDRSWSAGSLLRFAAPTAAMMLFMGLYTMTDTLFVARLVHTDALSAVNIVCPVVNLTVGLGTMIAAGGSALVSRKMGEGASREAREAFTLLVTAGAVIGLLILLAGTLWMEEIIDALGASRQLFPYCRDYLTVLLWFAPSSVLQTLFASLFVTAGRPGLGFGLSFLAGASNILFDWVLMALCGLGIRGAALGTGLGSLIPAAAGVVFFARGRGALFFTRPRWRWAVIRESCLNGSSEMVGQLATAVTTFLFNSAMMDLRGEDGVAAVTILIYSQFLLNTLFIGYSMGVAPVFGFYRGNRNRVLQVCRISIRFIAAVSLLVFAASSLGGPHIVRLFTGGSPEVGDIAEKGFGIFSFSFLFSGLNIFASAMFTALSDGRTSAALSFLRTFGLLAGGILLLPRILGITGVWLAVPAAEGLTSLVSVLCLIRLRGRYAL